MPELSDVTLVIPHRDTPDWLLTSVALWQAQSMRPFILVVDTASTSMSTEIVLKELKSSPGVEVSQLNVGKTEHASDSICHAMDYAFSRCPTTYLLATHVDVHPKRRDLVEHLMNLCNEENPVVGWEMSPRGPGGLQGDFTGQTSDDYPGHCCILFHMPTMDRIGAGWSIRRSANVFGSARGPDPLVKGWPDTETCLGNLFFQHGIKPHYLGRETNHTNQETQYCTHARSRTGLGETPRHQAAIRRARTRLKRWTGKDIHLPSEEAMHTTKSVESCPYRFPLGQARFGCGLLRTHLQTDNPEYLAVSRKTCESCRSDPRSPNETEINFSLAHEILLRGANLAKADDSSKALKAHARQLIRSSAQQFFKMLPSDASDELLSRLSTPSSTN